MKHQLRQYLDAKGIYPNDKKLYRCLKHEDNDPSVVFYKHGKNTDYPVLWCPICQETWSVFDIAGLLLNTTDFKEMKKDVMQTLNLSDGYESEKPVINKPAKSEPVALEVEEARKIYTKDRIIEIYKMSKHSRINKDKAQFIKSWPYRTADNKIIGMDVRFEDDEKKKDVVTFWYNGKSLKTSGAPVLVYNRDICKMYPDWPVLIHEGCKCADIGTRELGDFVSLSWSGGSHKAGMVDWSFLKNREVFILRDNDDPGLKAANDIKKQLLHAKIVTPPTSGAGDDIEQFLQALTPEELTEHILKVSDITSSEPTNSPQNLTDEGFSEPFKILGMCEGEGHFIDNFGYYQHYKLDSISKSKLLNIAHIDYWKYNYPAGKDGAKWDDAASDIITLCKQKEFNSKCLKGIGAWRDKDKICYNDGLNVYGEKSDKFIYLKDTREYIGLDHEPIDFEVIEKLRNIMFDLSFETKTDAVRTMGWSVLAPFCGALVHRPILFFTGESSTGKSEVQSLIVEKIAKLTRRDMRSSTTAGIRREIKTNSRCYFIDEAGRESEKMKLLFDDMMSFARSSYSDDSPDGVKANINGDGVVHFKFSSMFGFASTNPSIENVQDDNRVLRVHFVKPKHTSEQWAAIVKELSILLSEENCHKIRAFVWPKLKIIMELADKITTQARKRTNRDLRSSRADMLLASAYMVIWCNTPEPTEEQINNMLDKYYQYQPIEENRSESEEYVDRIMQEIIEVIHENAREKITIQECLQRSYDRHYKNDDGQVEPVDTKKASEYNRYLAMYGIKLIHPACVHIANNHHMIQKIINMGAGYGKLFTRHKGAVKYDKPVTYFGKSHRGTLINGLIVKQEKDKTEDEKLMGVM